MKLNPHQIEILDKIISGSVYDIPTYLSAFNRAKYHQHDISAIKVTFDAEEDGKTYFFKENDDGSFYTEIYDKEGNVTSVAPVSNQMTYYLKEYPNSSPVGAELDMKVAPIKVDFQGNSYSFDFLNDKYLVANNFDEIIDFLALWSYLKTEALIIEFNKPISKEEISIFFETIKQNVCPDNIPKWEKKITIDSDKHSAKGQQIVNYKQIPKKKTQGYITDGGLMVALFISAFRKEGYYMPTKIQLYAQLAEQTARQLTDSLEKWTAFLDTATRLYKYPYHEQLMIYAQRPDATACADYDTWNKTMRRYIRRGTKGIALIDHDSDTPKLKYVYDLADTGTRQNSRPVNLWQMEQEHMDSVFYTLEQNYGCRSVHAGCDCRGNRKIGYRLHTEP